MNSLIIIFIIIFVGIFLLLLCRKNTKEGMFNYYGVWNVKLYKCDANQNVNVLYDQGVIDLKNYGSGSFVSKNGTKYDVELNPNQGRCSVNNVVYSFNTSQAGAGRGQINMEPCKTMVLEKA